MSTPKPCMDCGRLPKQLPKHFCAWCILKRQPMHVQAEAARKRREAIPSDLRLKRSLKIVKEDTPDGLQFCAGCQTFCPEWMFAPSGTQCRPCVNAKAHESRTERVYGLPAEEYDRLLEFQEGRCAICGNKPSGKTRLAVDHDHQTGEVRGLLCAGERGCNRALGILHDNLEVVSRARTYLTMTPYSIYQNSGKATWQELVSQESFVGTGDDQEKPPPARPTFNFPSSRKGKKKKPEAQAGTTACLRPHYLPVGAIPDPEKKGVWMVWCDAKNSDPPF